MSALLERTFSVIISFFVLIGLVICPDKKTEGVFSPTTAAEKRSLMREISV